jgi:predicted PurR-regulated permease PerM
MPGYGRFARYVLIVFAIGVALLALWQVARVLLLGFGGVLFAVAIRAGGSALARHLPIPARWASLLVVLALAAALTLLTMVLGDEVARQIIDLQQRLPGAIARARESLQDSELGRTALSFMSGAATEGFSAATAFRAASATFGVLTDMAIVILLALYLSFSPRTYMHATVELAPPRYQAQVRGALLDTGHALHRWLLGQFVSMTSVGLLTGFGLWLVGVPNAAILGLVAGLLEFVPILGPLVAAVPGIVLALAQGPTTALYAALVYLVVQQLEGSLIMPLAQKWAVELPPALGLLTVVLFGVLFGIPGVLFATPLTVVIMVLVRRFYLERRSDGEAATERPGGSDAADPPG